MFTMISAIRKFFSRGETPQSEGVASVDAQPDHVGRKSESRSGRWKFSSRKAVRQEMLKGPECVFDQETISLVPWRHTQAKRIVKWHMAEMSDKLPKRCGSPKLVDNVKFVLSKEGRPICLGECENGVVFLVTSNAKLRALKVAYKYLSRDREVIYEAALRCFISPSGVTPKMYGLVGVKSSQFTGVGILSEFLGTEKGCKAPSMQELLDGADYFCMQPKTWKTLILKLCDQVRKTQELGVHLLNMTPKNIVFNLKTNQFVITDLGRAIYTSAKLKFDNNNVPFETFFRTYPFHAPELFLHSKLHANNDTYSLAKMVLASAKRLGVTGEQAHFVLAPFLVPEPGMRPTIEQMKDMLEMYTMYSQSLSILQQN